MKEYAKINSNRQVEQLHYFEELPPHKAGYILPVITDEKPTIDESIEFIIEGFYRVESDAVYRTWIVMQKSPEEIAKENRKTCTPLQLWNAIGTEKQTAIFIASESDPNVKMFLYMLGMATQIESDHPQTVAGLNYMISQNLLTQEDVDNLFSKV